MSMIASGPLKRVVEIIVLGTSSLGALLWIWSLSPPACHSLVIPTTQIHPSNIRVVSSTDPHVFRFRYRQIHQKNLKVWMKDDDDDDSYTPYYDGEYHLEPKDNNMDKLFTKPGGELSGAKRIRPNFEAVFQGMPGLSDILSGGKKDNQKISSTNNIKNTNKLDRTAPQTTNDDRDDDDDDNGEDEGSLQGQLSTSDMEEIERNFQRFKREMRETLQNMRRKDPNSVPEDAELILDQVVEEQRAYDIQEKTDLRAMQAFDEYYQKQRTLHSSMDTKQQREAKQNLIDTDPVVQEIVEEMNQTQEDKRQIQQRFQDFKIYEKKLQEKLKKEYAESRSYNNEDTTNIDFDQVQLDIMRDLLIKRQEAAMEKGMVDDEDLYTTNNLEDGIEELSNLMEEKQRQGKDAMGGSKWSLKDWQMYRSIVSKLSDKKKRQSIDDYEDEDDEPIDENDIMDLDDLLGDEDDEEEADIDNSPIDKKVISKKMESWREYQIKEENMRKKMGLTVNVRTPFPWSDKLYKGETDSEKKDVIPGSSKKSFSRSEVEKASLFLDQTAVEVMTDLMMKTQDKERREKLRLEIEELKAEITRREKRDDGREAINDYQFLDDDVPIGQPVQISDILGNTKGSNPLEKRELRSEQEYHEKPSLPIQEVPSIPPPSTGAADIFLDMEDDEEMVPTLGTLKEQKFRSLVARSGVRTVQEQEQLREKWEDFQRAEQRMRDQTGLSGKDVPSFNLQGQLKYNVSEVLLKGGDVNADAILSTLGQRPSRKNKSSSASATVMSEAENKNPLASTSQTSNQADFVKQESKKDSYQSFLEYEERMKAQLLRQQNTTGDSNIVSASSKSADDQNISLERDEVSENIPEQIYRSYGATIHRDPEKNREDKNAFEELLRREEEVRKSLQDTAISSSVGSDIDIDTYAEDILSRLKPRPKPNKIKRKSDSESDVLSEASAKTPKSTEDTDDDSMRPSSIKDKIKTSNVSRSSSILTEQIPDWLRREIGERKGEELPVIERGKSDDGLERFYDNYDDEDYEERERQAAEFERKYSKASKGVSISDLFGRDYFGPDDVGDYYDGQSPSDYFSSFESRKSTLMEYRVLSVEDLNSLMEYKSSPVETGVSPYLAKVNRPFSSFGAILRLEGSLLDIQGLHYGPWKKTAEEHGLKVPDLEDVKYAAVHSPEFSIQRIFYWTNDIMFVRSIAKTFRRNFAEFFESWISRLGLTYADEVSTNKGQEDIKVPSNALGPGIKTESSKDDRPFRTKSSVSLSEFEMLNLQFNVWSKVANKFGFKAPSIENVRFTSGFTPEEVVKGVFMWSRDTSSVTEMAAYYTAVMKEETDKVLGKKINDTEESPQNSVTVKPEQVNDQNDKGLKDTVKTSLISQSTGPVMAITEDDVIELHLKAWTHAAEQHGYKTPSLEEVQVAKFSGPDKAVQSIFKWTSSSSSISDVVATFRLRLKNLSLDLAAKVNANLSPTNREERVTANDDPVPYIVKDGIVDFLSALAKVNMPCAVISHLDSHQMDVLLQVSGLNRFFKADQRVSGDVYETEVQQLLGAALRVERRPDVCAVFTSSPQSCVAAHDAQMKSVALVGPYPRYDLTASDSTLINIGSMNTMNLRALFSDEKSAEPMEQLQVEGPQVKKKSMVKTRFWQDGDR